VIVKAVEAAYGAEYPRGTVRIAYTSGFDAQDDWALFVPGDKHQNTIVYLHGSFAHADQIFIRRDIRDFWLSRIMAGRHPLLSVNMRGTSYMSPAATADMSDLLDYASEELSCTRFVLLGGSCGASSAVAYALLHPQRVHGVIAMGMCDILARLDFARRSDNPVLRDLARTVFAAYGATPEEKPGLYQARSILAHPDRMTMPFVLTMGEHDVLIPVAETRRIEAAMRDNPDFIYHEVPGGDHDSALWVDVDLDTLRLRGCASG
jgi:pimeloyl-ACP methyl ester carboxylesterase